MSEPRVSEEPNGAPADPHGAAAHLKSRVLRGAFWFLSGTAARAMLRLLVIAVLARLLAPADFGLVSAAGVVIALADLVSTSGIIMPLVQRRDITRRHVETAYTVNLITGLASGGVVYLIAPWIAALFRMPALEPILQVIALLFPMNAVSAISQKLLERDLLYGRIAAADFVAYVLGYAAVALALAFAGAGVWSLVFAALGTALVRGIVLLVYMPQPVRLSFHWREYRELMETGLGYALIRFINFVALKGDYFVVGRWLGATALGFYERAYLLMDLSNTLVLNSLSTVLFPAFSRLQQNRKAMALAFLRSSAILALTFCPLAAAAAIVAPEIVTVLLGRGWDAVVLPFQILALGMFFRAGYKLSAVVANSVGAVYRNGRSQAIYAVLVVGGAWVAIPYGIAGVAVSTLLALAVVYLLLTSVALNATGLAWKELLKAYAPAALSTLVVGAVVAAIALPLRASGVWGPAILAATGAAALGVIATAVLARPSLFGRHGEWLLRELTGRLRTLARRRGRTP